MASSVQLNEYAIGWDVGGWNCDRNRLSRDAIVIMDSSLKIFGTPWRGNLRECINESATRKNWIAALFKLCKGGLPDESAKITLAIDTPLGFSESFVKLVTREGCIKSLQGFYTNQYLFRRTEIHLCEAGLKPLSAVNHMIGSQATKGMHALAKFAPNIESCGVWSDGENFRVIETYPAACEKKKTLKELLKKPLLRHLKNLTGDKYDAGLCALIGHLFATNLSALDRPGKNIPPNEGWIWVPTK